MDGIKLSSETKTDSCFKQNFLDKVICKIQKIIIAGSPPYETYFELRDEYVLRTD